MKIFKAGLEVRWVRFLIIGGTNTLATGALVGILSLHMPGWVAFTVSFGLGIVFSALLTGRWVFQSASSTKRTSLFALSYLVVYLAGLSVIALFSAMQFPAFVNSASVLVTAPLSFMAGRFIFTDDYKRERVDSA